MEGLSRRGGGDANCYAYGAGGPSSSSTRQVTRGKRSGEAKVAKLLL